MKINGIEMALFYHDAFSRESTCRERVYTRESTCMFCGQQKKTKGGRTYLYHYYSVSDGGTVRRYPGLFCGIDCMRAYNGQ